MRIEENEAGGTSVIIGAGDEFGEIPESHRKLLTRQLREAMTDPPSYFRRIAEKSLFPSMAHWLRTLVGGGVWELALHIGVPPIPDEWSAAGIRWWSEEVRGAEITPANDRDAASGPPTLRHYYSLVDRVSWVPFGRAGGLYGRDEHSPLTNFYDSYHGADIDPARTFTMGTSPGGDLLIYTSDGRGGWLCHENGKIHLLGSIEETINWVYEELLADRCPEFDDNWA